MTHITKLMKKCARINQRFSNDINSDNKVAMIAEIDMTNAINFREKYYQLNQTKPSYTALIAKSIAMALEEHPHANRLITGLPFFKTIHQFSNTHIAVAVERDLKADGKQVYVAVMRDVGDKNLKEIHNDLYNKAHQSPEEDTDFQEFLSIIKRFPTFLAYAILSIPKLHKNLWQKFRGGSVLISSPCKYGVDTLVGHWNWPLGVSFGLIKKRPIVIDDQIEARFTMNLTFSFDRSLMLGAPAAQFLNCIANHLRNADFELSAIENKGAVLK